MIQATTPFVQPEHFDAALDRLEAGNFACVFTARKAEDHPRWTWRADPEGRAEPFFGATLEAVEQHGQNLPDAYYPTGACWAVRIAEMRSQDAVYCSPLGIVEMPWYYSIDIDDERDWTIAETVAKTYQIEPVASARAKI